MPAAKYNISIEQGATFKKKLTFKSAGSPQDLTGQVFRGQIRSLTSSTTALATFTCTVLDQITNTGEVEITLTPAQTSAIPTVPQTQAKRTVAQYAYDVEREFLDGRVERVLEGIAKVSPEVTR